MAMPSRLVLSLTKFVIDLLLTLDVSEVGDVMVHVQVVAVVTLCFKVPLHLA